jgi:hypothetical protein
MSDARHLADVICGECGNVMRIALGMAHAIVCGECKTEIVLGEDTSDYGAVVDEVVEMFQKHLAEGTKPDVEVMEDFVAFHGG